MNGSRTPAARRRGLAPFEFVAALPFILFMSALIFVVGAAGLVKSRGQVNARYAMFREVGIRGGSGDPNPRNWSEPALIRSGGGVMLASTDAVWNADANLMYQGIRGVGTVPGGSVPVEKELEIGDGLVTGTAEYRRPLPLLQGTLGKQTFDVELTHEVVGEYWNFAGFPFELPDHVTYLRRDQGGYLSDFRTRGETWYDLGEQLVHGDADLNAAHNALLGSGLGEALDPLDRDPELRDHYVPDGRSTPDFHPRFPSIGETTESGTRANGAWSGLLDAISRVPSTMADRFISVYREQREELAAVDPDDPAIADLDAKIAQMENFRDSLPDLNQ